MNNRPPRKFFTVIWRAILQALLVVLIVGCLMYFFYGFIQYYQQQQRHIQQIGALLAHSASSVNGASTVARQVDILLSTEPSIKSIVFYSTTQPIIDNEPIQTSRDWQNAWFASSISTDYPVTSVYVDNDVITDHAQSMTTNASVSKNLVGYINITLDIDTLRTYWLQRNIWPALSFLLFIILGMLFIRRAIRKPARDIAALSSVSTSIIDKPALKQLPLIQQRYRFEELLPIKQALISLFNRLQDANHRFDALTTFEQQLRSKERSLNVQHHNFQSMITHELQTSLNAIVGGLQLLEHQKISTEQRDAVNIIDKGSRQLIVTLEQIIQLNKIEKNQISLRITDFNPLQLIADLLTDYEPIAKQKGLTLNSHVHHIDYTLNGDGKKIQQMLSILLDNAIKFTISGHITITSQLTHFNRSNRWQISIKDTGIGIDEQYLDEIFNPFFQVDSSQTRVHEGIGIGLPLVKQLSQLMDATIEVDSRLNKGSTFTLTITLPERPQRQQKLLKDLVVIYFYYQETSFLCDELSQLGATVIGVQQEQALIDELQIVRPDVVMFAEDVLPQKAEMLAKRIREYEGDNRTLLIYWYLEHQLAQVDDFEHMLKAAGIDYCHVSVQGQALASVLKKWLWT